VSVSCSTSDNKAVVYTTSVLSDKQGKVKISKQTNLDSANYITCDLSVTKDEFTEDKR
jgi:hypothetical protein